MKFKCVKCGAKYFHNFFTDPEKKMKHGCRFCGGKMVKDKITDEEFGEHYLGMKNKDLKKKDGGVR